jgi:hypothetical protein
MSLTQCGRRADGPRESQRAFSKPPQVGCNTDVATLTLEVPVRVRQRPKSYQALLLSQSWGRAVSRGPCRNMGSALPVGRRLGHEPFDFRLQYQCAPYAMVIADACRASISLDPKSAAIHPTCWRSLACHCKLRSRPLRSGKRTPPGGHAICNEPMPSPKNASG